MYRVLGPALVLIGLVPASSRADGPKGLDFFEKKIRPVLTEQCGQCHSAEAEAKKKLKGGLRLDTRDGLRKGGDSGPAVVPGKPADSLLIQAIKYDGDTRMP
ncbi:MAG: hypothetical protein J2P46_15715, partial [Zavarzinella sp.]|nr:hypothetical protein [Zavarzinella sp.]